MSPLRLNLACGTDIRPAKDGWVNLDIVSAWPGYPPCDILWDARKDRIPFPDDSIAEVVAGYLLLHLAPIHHDRVLEEIYRVMMSGAKLQVGEVDMEKALRRWIADPRDASAIAMIWGEQGEHEDPRFREFAEFDKHCCGFTYPTLQELLLKHRFLNIHQVQIHAPEVWYELTVECLK